MEQVECGSLYSATVLVYRATGAMEVRGNGNWRTDALFDWRAGELVHSLTGGLENWCTV